MKLSETKQVSIDYISSIEFDIAFFSCGYEERSTFLFGINKVNSSNIKVLVFNKNLYPNIEENEYIFKKSNNCDFIYSDGENEEIIFQILNDFIKNNSSLNEINILIDYSSMTKVWFSSFLYYFKYNEHICQKINLYFSYSHAKYSPPQEENEYDISVEPIRGFCNISLPDKPTALIIGLGYEKKMALGLSQFLDAESYVFYSDNSYESKYGISVTNNNALLLKEVKENNIFTFPILDLCTTENILISLLIDLLQTNRIILAPCGPKIFALICLVQSIKFKNVDVWRISKKNGINVSDKLADGMISIYQITFENQ